MFILIKSKRYVVDCYDLNVCYLFACLFALFFQLNLHDLISIVPKKRMQNKNKEEKNNNNQRSVNEVVNAYCWAYCVFTNQDGETKFSFHVSVCSVVFFFFFFYTIYDLLIYGDNYCSFYESNCFCVCVFFLLVIANEVAISIKSIAQCKL